jgi:molybdopterin-guanine dinucleotide biosynthesis protein A
MEIQTAVIVLTGGTSRRFGSDKSVAILNGMTLLEHVLSHIDSGSRIILVGDELEVPRHKTISIREQPIHSGPVSALASALPLVTEERIFLIATDMPFGSLGLARLAADWKANTKALIPIDAEGFLQPLCALYSTKSLNEAMLKLGRVENRSMKELIHLIDYQEYSFDLDFADILLDIDSPADLLAATRLSKRME